MVQTPFQGFKFPIGAGTIEIGSGPLQIEVTINDGGDTISIDDGGTTVSIDDGGGSITIDGTVNIGNIGALTGANKIPINEFAENVAVVSTVDSVVLTYTVPLNVTANIQGMVVTGQAAGRFKLKLNGVTKSIVRTTAAKTTELVDFEDGPIVGVAGDVFTVVGYHEEIPNLALAANLFGYRLP